ncbi:Acetaldehyde dehydrogenase 6 [Bienertia sinuspersici]
MASEGRSSSKDPTNSGSRKHKKDSLVEAVNSYAESFREYVQSKIKDTPRPTCQEIHAVVFQELPEDEKLEWVLLCLGE